MLREQAVRSCRCRWRAQSGGGTGAVFLACTIGEKAVVTNADEAIGQDMLQETTQKLGRIEFHHPVTVAANIVLVAEAHRVRVQGRDPAVGDGDAMGIAGEIFQHLLGSAEGSLGIHHPLLGAQLLAQCSEATGISQIGKGTMELETVGSEVLLQRRQHLSAKQP